MIVLKTTGFQKIKRLPHIYIYIEGEFFINHQTLMDAAMDGSSSDFYVHLISSEGLPHEENNIFSNRIRPSVQIDGDFKVALDNIFFEESYVAIKKGDVNYSVYFDMIEFDEKQSPTKTKSIVYTPKTDFVVKTIEDLIAKLNHELLKVLLEKNVIIARNTIDFIILKDGRVHIDPITTDFEDVPEKKKT